VTNWQILGGARYQAVRNVPASVYDESKGEFNHVRAQEGKIIRKFDSSGKLSPGRNNRGNTP